MSNPLSENAAEAAPSTALSSDEPERFSSVNRSALWAERSAAPFQIDENEFALTDDQQAALSELTSSQKKQFFDLVATLSNRSDQSKASVQEALMNEMRALLTLRVNGKLLLLSEDKSGEGKNCLDHFTAIANTSDYRLSGAFSRYVDRGLASEELGKKEGNIQVRDSYFRSMIREILNVHGSTDLNQGAYTSCVPIYCTQYVVGKNPAEYARMMQEAVTQGYMRMWAQTDPSQPPQLTEIVNLVEGSLDSDSIQNRSYSESVLQEAVGQHFGSVVGGFYKGGGEKLAEALSGEPVTRIDCRVRNAEGTFTDTRALMLPALDEALKTDGFKMASIVWAENGKAHNNHAIGLTDHKDEKVYFQIYFKDTDDKNFSSEIPDNMKGLVTLEDPERQIYSISEADFLKRVNYVFLSATDPNEAFGVTAGADDPENDVLTHSSALKTVEVILGKAIKPEMKRKLVEASEMKTGSKAETLTEAKKPNDHRKEASFDRRSNVRRNRRLKGFNLGEQEDFSFE